MGDTKFKRLKYEIGYKNEFGWEIIDVVRKNKRVHYKIKCPCGCNETHDVRGDYVDNYKQICNYQKSLIPPKHMPRELYKTRLINQQFGLLKVLDFFGYNKNKEILYLCECQCQNKTLIVASYNQLKSGKKDNCGCMTLVRISESKRKYNKYDLSGEYGIGWTTNTNKEFYFDLEDYDKIKNYCWFEHKNREDDEDGYLEARQIGSKYNIKFHRLVMGIDITDIKVDHIKHKLLDNRKSQLRISSNQENCMNHVLHSNNTTGISGVNFDKEKQMYRVRIYYKMKTIHLGYYSTIEEAEYIRKQAEEKYFKEWSYDNSMKYGEEYEQN